MVLFQLETRRGIHPKPTSQRSRRVDRLKKLEAFLNGKNYKKNYQITREKFGRTIVLPNFLLVIIYDNKNV